MTEEQEVAPEQEATEEVVTEEVAQEEEQDEQTEAEAPEEEGEAEEDEASKPKSRHQRRKEQTERYRQEAETWKAKAQEAQAKLSRLSEHNDPMPKQDDFASYEEYQAALSAHHAMRALDGRQRKETEAEAQAYQREIERVETERKQEIAQEWASQVADARSKYADFEQVAFKAPISEQVADVIMSMDGGTDVAYHLGMNPADAQRISALSPLDAAMELGRIEARLSRPKPRTATQAPNPVSPVRPKASAVKSPSEMTPAEFRKWRESGGTF